MKMQFGNNDFMLNAVNYLADDGDWMKLKNKKIKLPKMACLSRFQDFFLELLTGFEPVTSSLPRMRSTN